MSDQAHDRPTRDGRQKVVKNDRLSSREGSRIGGQSCKNVWYH